MPTQFPVQLQSSGIDPSLIVSIFDFDGTLFRSPSPSASATQQYPAIAQPYSSKGLGWFHNHWSLAPPFVPDCVGNRIGESIHFKGFDESASVDAKDDEGLHPPLASSFQLSYDAFIQKTTPSRPGASAAASAISGTSASPSPFPPTSPHDAFDRWFISPTVDAYVAAKKRGDITAILTGREAQGFTHRVDTLLSSAGFSFDHLFLKQEPGTIAFKINVFINIVKQYKPRRIVYYEDRYEQGVKMQKGFLRALQHEFGGAAENAAEETDTNASTSGGSSSITNLATYYSSPDNFAIVYVPKAIVSADTMLAPHDEAQLIEFLLKDRERLCGSGGKIGNKGRK